MHQLTFCSATAPGLTIRPLSPVPLSDAANPTQTACGALTHLEWLEDVDLPTSSVATDATEPPLDVRLLAVTASSEFVHRRHSGSAPCLTLSFIAAHNSTAHSALATYSFTNLPYVLSEAFAALECKKGDATAGEPVWSARRLASCEMPGLVTSVLPRFGTDHGSFVVAEAKPDEGGEGWATWLLPLKAETLETLDHLGRTKLPTHDGERLHITSSNELEPDSHLSSPMQCTAPLRAPQVVRWSARPLRARTSQSCQSCRSAASQRERRLL